LSSQHLVSAIHGFINLKLGKGLMFKLYDHMFDSTIFSNIKTITEEEMSAISFGIYKVVFDLHIKELDDAEFYEDTENLNFFVHR
jgi:hypothetical protein